MRFSTVPPYSSYLPIGERRKELVDEVAMGPVNLRPVKTHVAATARAAPANLSATVRISSLVMGRRGASAEGATACPSRSFPCQS